MILFRIHQHIIIEFGGIHLESFGHLAEVVDAIRGVRTPACPLKRWQQNGRQDRDGAKNDQQFDQGEYMFALFHCTAFS